MYVVDFIEVKAYPLQANLLDFEDLGRNIMGLFWRMMKSYFSTGRYLILDSGFCVLKRLIQLRKKVIFSCDVIKKRRYWPSMVPDKETEDHFWRVEVGDTYAIQGTVDGDVYNVWSKKERIYVMRMMDTGGCLLADDTCKETVITWK